MSEATVLTRENYFDFGDDLNVVVSNSSLGYINPNQGGSLLRFKKYLAGDNEKRDSLSMERGKLLHKYMEDKDNFAIEEDDAPSDAIKSVVQAIFDNVRIHAEEFKTLAEQETRIIAAAIVADYGQSWKQPTMIGKVIEQGEKYYQYLISSSDKVMLSAATKDCLLNMINTLEQSAEREEIIDRKPSEYPTPFQANLLGEPGWFAREHPVLFEHKGHKCKALLDHIYIDFKEKHVYLRDLKTTSKPPSTFMGTMEFANINHEKIGMRYQNGAFQNYHYYRQLAFYYLAIRSILPPEDVMQYKYTLIIHVVESVDPYEMVTFMIPKDWIDAGLAEINELITLVEEYKKTI